MARKAFVHLGIVLICSGESNVSNIGCYLLKLDVQLEEILVRAEKWNQCYGESDYGGENCIQK